MIAPVKSFIAGVVKGVFSGAGGITNPDGTWVVPFHKADTGMRFGGDSQKLTNPDGSVYHYKGIKVVRHINGQEYTSSAGGAVRHDELSTEAKRANLEQQLADLK